MDASTFDKAEFKTQLESELTGNILPFWLTHVVDEVNGGFHGAVTNDLQIRDDVPRSAVLCARILWTFATAYRRLGGAQYLWLARWAYDTLRQVFWDAEYGGVYWLVNRAGEPVSDRKHHYAQAFAMYGLSAFYQATHEPHSLDLAQTLFGLLEEHAYEPIHHGYIEGCDRRWGPLADMRLGEEEPNCRKSMNTMLHVLEAYGGLLRVWQDSRLARQHRDLLETFMAHVVDSHSGHLRPFFDHAWRPLSEQPSFGHDIEASWLIPEAAEIQGDPELLQRSREAGIRLAAAVARDGLDRSGGLSPERTSHERSNSGKSWWAQAEAVVGFYNAYQRTGDARLAQTSHDCWDFIRARFVDRVHGDWFKRLAPDGTPDNAVYKAGPWECPYHHSRACFEMLERLDA